MRAAFLVIAMIVPVISSGPSIVSFAQESSPSTHSAWVAESLRKMETIKPGMTRADLRTVFTTEAASGVERLGLT